MQLTQEATWLIIFDNADDPALLTDYWPQGNGSVLITSRDPLAKSLFSMRTSGVDLHPLTTDEGASLIMQLTSESSDEADPATKELAARITDRLGGIPLAISQMTGIIRRQDLTLAEFMDLYEDRKEHGSLHNTRFELAARYPHTVSTVWALDELKEGRRLLNLIAFFDPDTIDEELLREVLMESRGLPSTTTVAAQSDSYRNWRTELLQTSLIRRIKEKNEVSVHRLVQDVVLSKMSDTDVTAAFSTVIRKLWHNWPSGLPTPSRKPTIPQPMVRGKLYQSKRWTLCAALYPHVLRLHQIWPSVTNLDAETKIVFVCLLGDAAWYDRRPLR